MSQIREASARTSRSILAKGDTFLRRHLGVDAEVAEEMARYVGFDSVDALVDQAVPDAIRTEGIEGLPEPVGEHDMLEELRAIARKNRISRSYIGQGYANTITPPVIQRNLLENPGWYTQYTPYQAEISQGRMEALLNFQTMVRDLTGLDIANASLLDEATAAAEAVTMAYGAKGKRGRSKVLLSRDCHPQTIDVVKTRAEPLAIEASVVDAATELDFSDAFAIVIQYPDTHGIARDFSKLAEKAKAGGAVVIACCDLLALALLKPPGEMGADIAVGSAQRFGVPMGYGGPHAAFLATTDAYKRKIPGRLIGVSIDAHGNPALRLALQTREQHIRRDKATSNICTAQALLANIASAYAVYHGPDGIRTIAARVRKLARVLQAGLEQLGYEIDPGIRFDTVSFKTSGDDLVAIRERAEGSRLNFRYYGDSRIGLSLDETVGPDDLMDILNTFAGNRRFAEEQLDELLDPIDDSATEPLNRQSPFLTHPVFNSYHTETEMLRYLKRLENKDLSLTGSMIPLGSCTMKLNAAAEMLPISWNEFASLHPFVPSSQAAGYLQLIEQLKDWLARITGFAAVSLQPNAGSQGEYAGLLAIRHYHRSCGEEQRDVCLIPVSAHGTNPASAVMAGMTVKTVLCDKRGNIDLADLREKTETYADRLSTLMVTYPSTHGVFEPTIREVCQIIHEGGGQVYMDGANMNAQCGLTSPGAIGADVCHLNLHKTFCIPHGGGGPGVGPIGVAEHLAGFLPGHVLDEAVGGANGVGAVAAAPFGSAGILPISWAYIRMMGSYGLTEATKIAILNANYMAKRLEGEFDIVYRGESGLVAHEFIVDFRSWKERAGIEVEDVAKRLMDYGFHAPTMSWPVAGTMMIEPTESESKPELDRLCDALLAIKAEMHRVESGEWPRESNPLKNAPHTARRIAAAVWDAPYSRQQAAFPTRSTQEWKYWPSVGRVDNVYGDRNLVCACLPMESYSE